MSNPLLGDDEQEPLNKENITASIDSLLSIMAASKPVSLKKRQPKKIRKPSHIVQMDIGESELPEEASKVNITNVVKVPKKELEDTVDSVNIHTKKLSRRLMQKLVPLLLSYNSSTQYVQAAMREGLGFELSFDQNLADSIKYVGHLNVIFHFIKHSPIPKDLKQHFMFELSRQLATKTFETIVNRQPAQTTDLASAIHAIIGGKRVSSKQGELEQEEKKIGRPAAASRRRRG